MKLTRIELENVYGHKHTDVDLGDVSAAVVCGDNGAGKSSLIAYGPLWALYGRNAIQGDTYDDLVRGNAEQASAAVTFEMGAQTYRVRRTYSRRTKAGKSDLEFLALMDDGEWRPEATGSIGEVEDAIEHLLGVDYETLVTGSVQTQSRGSMRT